MCQVARPARMHNPARRVVAGSAHVETHARGMVDRMRGRERVLWTDQHRRGDETFVITLAVELAYARVLRLRRQGPVKLIVTIVPDGPRMRRPRQPGRQNAGKAKTKYHARAA